MKKLFRRLRKIVAYLAGTFVADCPKCHKYFFGFNRHIYQVMIDQIHYRIVCHRCARHPRLERR